MGLNAVSFRMIAGGPQTKMGEIMVIDEVNLQPMEKSPCQVKVNVADYISGGMRMRRYKYLNSLLYGQLTKFPRKISQRSSYT